MKVTTIQQQNKNKQFALFFCVQREQEEDLPMMIIMEVDGPTHWDRTPLHHHHHDDDDDYIEFPESSRKSDPIDPDYDPITVSDRVICSFYLAMKLHAKQKTCNKKT